MNLSEAEKYHQIHPFKLWADVIATIVSLILFWQHQLYLGLIFHFAPPIIASFTVIQFANLEKIKESSFGKYVGVYMNRWMEFLRLFGDLLMVLGAWYQSYIIILIGLLIILTAWSNGMIRRKLSST